MTSNSTGLEVEYGETQCSVLGPLCFSVYVNDMQESLDCSLDQFADDSMLHDCGDTMDKVIASLQRNTLEIENYSICNSVTIHPDKYVKSIIISKQRFIDLLPKIEINGQCIIIAVVKASKCLGITIDQELSWEAHVQSTSKNFSGKIEKNNFK